jgi:S-DNA-T family DNA segregation ATPase FtsK/SpoIIIE
VLLSSQDFAGGGAVGDLCKDYLFLTIGTIGTFLLIGVAFLAYVIWRFNPSFNFPVKKGSTAPMDGMEEAQAAASLTINHGAAAQSARTSKFGEDDEDEEDLFPTAAITGVSSNELKGNVGTMNPVPHQEPAFNHELTIIEKDEEPIAKPSVYVEKPIEIPPVVEAPVVTIPLVPKPMVSKQEEQHMHSEDGLELEIKSVEQVAEENEMEAAGMTPEKVQQLKPYDPILDLRDYRYPSLELLENHGSERIVQDPQELENNKNQIINTLKNYDINIQKISATVGPTVTLYEIIPAAGVRISRIKNLEDDIALSLAALGIRIIAPIPGKGTIGIEVPNTKKTVVSMKTLLSSEKFQKNTFSLPIAIGKKIDNENFIVDLASMPHLLMAGATGQGKSVGLNAILVSLLYKKHPSQLKFVLVDPKKVELSIYKKIERHFLAKLPGEEDAIITDTKKVVHTLNALCIEMDNRYDLLKEAGCRNIKEYNEKFAARKLNPEKGHQYLPFIVLVVDEFADLIMTAGKEVEMPITRLAQLARAIGIHLIIATQRPSVNIITGTIKANFPARIAFKVSSKIDSRTILDTGGAEQLIGKGDMLISYNGEVVRLQCAFVDTPEVDKIVDCIGEQRGYPDAFLLPEYIDEKEMENRDFDVNDKDALFEDAARLIVASQSGSTSLLQRRMKLGYNRAGRLMDQLEAAGIVGASQGSKVRDVLIKTEADLQDYLNNMM